MTMHEVGIATSSSWIYIAQLLTSEGPRIKIGFTTGDVDKRLVTHANNWRGRGEVSLLCAVRSASGKTDEGFIHRHFNHCLVPGFTEEFWPYAELVGWIRWLAVRAFARGPHHDAKYGESRSIRHYDQWGPADGRWLPEPHPIMKFRGDPFQILELTTPRVIQQRPSWADWVTSPLIVEAARKTMGSIDLDPCSSEGANITVKATEFIDEVTDGLRMDWYDNVLVAPVSSDWDRWGPKVLSEWGSGRLTAMCAVIQMRGVSAKQFTPVLRQCNAFFVSDGRLPNGGSMATDSPDDGTAVLYFGSDWRRFMDAFEPLAKPIGTVLVRCQR